MYLYLFIFIKHISVISDRAVGESSQLIFLIYLFLVSHSLKILTLTPIPIYFLCKILPSLTFISFAVCKNR